MSKLGNIAQGTIEYLIIIGIVVVLSLVVTGLILSQTSSGSNTVGVANKIAMKSAGIAVNESVAGEDGNLFLNFSNNLGETITITGLEIDGAGHSGLLEVVSQGSSRAFVIPGLDSCEGTSKVFHVIIEYTSEEGLPKELDYGDVLIDCTPTVNPIVAYVDTNTGEVGGGDIAGVDAIYGIIFEVKDSSDETELSGVDITCDESEYDRTNQDYGSSIDFNEGTYYCDFSKDDYDSNTNFSVVVDENKTYTVLLTILEVPNQGISFVGSTPENESTLDVNYFDVNIDSNISSVHYIFTNLDNSLVGWWRGENNADDDSGTGNNGVEHNGVTYAPGVFGQAFSFDGGSQFVNCGDTPIGFSTGNSDRAAFAWIKFDRIDTEIIVGWGEDTSYQASNIRVINGGDGYGRLMFHGYSADFASNSQLSEATWYHVGFTVTNGYLMLYVNGEPDVSPINVGYLNTPLANCKIGKYMTHGDVWENFDGLIDEVMIFNRALSASEIKSLYDAQSYAYNNNFSNLNSGDHNFTAYAIDSAGNKYETENRVVSVSAEDGFGAVRFTIDDYEGMNFNYAISTKSDTSESWVDGWTVDYWAKIEPCDNGPLHLPYVQSMGAGSITDDIAYSSMVNPSTIRYFNMAMDDGDIFYQFAYQAADGYSGISLFTPDGLMFDGNWHHIEMSSDGANSWFFTDGQLSMLNHYPGWCEQECQQGYYNTAETTYPALGFFTHTYYRGGSCAKFTIAKARFSDGTRHASDTTFTPPTIEEIIVDGQTLALWDFPEMSGSTVEDISGNGYDLNFRTYGEMSAPEWVADLPE